MWTEFCSGHGSDLRVEVDERVLTLTIISPSLATVEFSVHLVRGLVEGQPLVHVEELERAGRGVEVPINGQHLHEINVPPGAPPAAIGSEDHVADGVGETGPSAS